VLEIDKNNNEELVQELVSAFRQFPKMFAKQSVFGQKRSELMVLFCIKKSGQSEMMVSEISKRLHVKAPTVTQLINELESKGHVERITNASDRRSVWIKVTEVGEEIIQRAEQEIQKKYSGLVDYLGEEESKQFISTLNKMYAYFSERTEQQEQKFEEQ
jgi:DNA-binding MarR family transcriptional regulator